MSNLTTSGQLVTLLGLVILFPLLVILLGEAQRAVRLRGGGYDRSIALLRNVVLPLTAIYLLIVYVGRLPQDGLVVKLFITAAIIVGLVAVLGILNGALFGGSASQRVPKLFLDLSRILIIFLGVAIVLSLVWGYDLNNLITALGVSSIVLGLALQDTLGNLFNGITLINERPFRVGDYVEVEGFAGQVVEVNWRAVRLLTRERDLIVLPHLKVAQSAIINHSQPEERWAQKMTLGFSYDNAPNRVKRIIMQTMLETPFILHEPEPECKVETFADSSVNYEVEYYISSFSRREEIKDDFMSRVWYAARRGGLEIPFPQLNIHRQPQRERAAAAADRSTADLRYLTRLLQIEPEYEHLLNHPQVRLLSFGEGEPIIERGRRAPGLYLIMSGEVRMTTLDAGADTVEMALLHRGDLATEIIDRRRRVNVVSVTAVEDTELVHLSEPLVRSLVNRYPELAHRLERSVVARRKQIQKFG